MSERPIDRYKRMKRDPQIQGMMDAVKAPLLDELLANAVPNPMTPTGYVEVHDATGTLLARRRVT